MDELIWRSLNGQATESEQAFLAAWRRSAPENEAGYQEMEDLVRIASVLLDPGPIPRRPAVDDILQAHIPLQAHLGDPGKRALSRPLRRWLGVGGVAATIALVLISEYSDRKHAAGGVSPLEFVTEADEIATVRLRDGSVVQVAPHSRLQILNPDGREVSLDGRAYFSVAPLDGRTFRVRAQGRVIEVLGTQFEVDTHRSVMRVAVAEGRVAVRSNHDRVEINAGEVGHLTGAATAVVKSANIGVLTDWASSVVVFSETRLEAVARELERVFNVRIEIAQGLPVGRTVSGTFINRSPGEALGAICEALALECVMEGEVGRIVSDKTK